MKDLHFNTVEEMVAWVVARPNSTHRYNLHVSTDFEYDDPGAGHSWIMEETPKFGTPERKAYFEREPSKHKVVKYQLRETGSHYYSNRTWIDLSSELGKQIEEVWPKKASRYSSTEEPCGARTLAGVLKLLGQSEISARVKEAKDKEKAESEKRRRNSYRRVVNEKLVALVNAVDESNKVAGLHFELPDFSELLALLQEEA